MNRVIALLFLTSTILGCSINSVKQEQEVSPVKITNFRYGLIEFDGKNNPKIYREGDTFIFEENGSCVAADKTEPCQWRGFEFDYESPYKVTTFECIAISNQAQDYVYPSKIVDKNSKSSKWGFSVEGHSGHYIRPQYTTGISGKPLHISFRCSNQGIEILKWKISLLPSQ